MSVRSGSRVYSTNRGKLTGAKVGGNEASHHSGLQFVEERFRCDITNLAAMAVANGTPSARTLGRRRLVQMVSRVKKSTCLSFAVLLRSRMYLMHC